MFSYTSAISKKWLAIVFHGPKLGNIRTPFGHFFGHSSASLSAISYEKSIAFLRGASLFYPIQARRPLRSGMEMNSLPEASGKTISAFLSLRKNG